MRDTNPHPKKTKPGVEENVTIVIYSGYFPKRMFPVQPCLSRSICFQFRIAKSTSENVRAVRARREVVKLTLRSRKVGWRDRAQFAFHKSRFWIIRCAHRGVDRICSTYQNGGKPRLPSSSPKSSPFSSFSRHLHSSLASAPSWTSRSSSYSVHSTLNSFAFSSPLFRFCHRYAQSVSPWELFVDEPQETDRTSWPKRKAAFHVLSARLHFVSVERLFSSAKLMIPPHRSSLKP